MSSRCIMKIAYDVKGAAIEQRGSALARQLIERGYLQSLNEAYAKFFHDYTAAPLLIVNAAAIDPIANSTDFEELYAAVIRVRKGRQYFNPMRHRAI